MRTTGLQCLLNQHAKKATAVSHGRWLGEVRSGPKTCIMLDAPLQDGAVQFGTGCDLDGLTRSLGVAWPLLYGFKISDMGTINYPDVSLYGILCPLPILH